MNENKTKSINALKLPSGWKKVRLKYIVNFKNGYAFNSDEFVENGVPLIRIGDITNLDALENSKKLPIEYADRYREFLINYNDIIIALTGATIGKSAINKSHDLMLLNQRVGVIRNSSIGQKYVYYFIDSIIFTDEIKLYCSGGAQDNIGISDIKNFSIAIPPVKIINSVVDFIESKLNEIDILIDSKLKQLRLLEQQRQSIITETVTKGLNPNVKIKDSGVEWIGEIPEHWTISKIKYTAELLNGDRGKNYPSGNDFVENGVPFITSHNLNNLVIDNEKSKYISEKKYNLLGGIKIQKNDIIYCLRGSVGKNAIALRDGGAIASSLMGIRAKNNIHPFYLLYVLNSKVEVWNRSLLTTGSVSDNLAAENVGTYIIPFPIREEQELIVSYLDENVGRINNIVINVNLQIEKLKEYRQSLIYEAVTGKIDVSEMELEEVR